MPTPRSSGSTQTWWPDHLLILDPHRTGIDGFTKPAMARSAVVLPHPDAPSRQPMRPCNSSKLSRSTTCSSPDGVA
jgi:hypothetical protein